MSRNIIPVGENEQAMGLVDSPTRIPDQVDRRLVSPVHILDHHHSRSQRTHKQLKDSLKDLTTSARQQRFLEAGLRKGHVPNRTKRLRNLKIVTTAPQKVSVLSSLIAEDLDDRRLPYTRLTSNHNQSPGSLACFGKPRAEMFKNGVSLK